MVNKPSYEQLTARIAYLESELEQNKQKDKEIIQVLSEDFQRLAERSPDAIYHFDIESNTFVFFNRLFLDLFSVEEDGEKVLSTRSVLLHIHGDDVAQVKAAKADSLKGGKIGGETDYRFLHPDGSVRWMHDRWTVIRDPQDQATAIEGFIRDNTERKQAEQEIEESRRHALIGSYIVQDGKFVYVNPEFKNITGYDEAELLGSLSLELVHPRYRELVRENAAKMLKRQRASAYEFSIVSRGGDIRWILETVTSISYQGRRAVLGYFMDITRNKQAEQDRRERERLQGVLEMAGAVCHELNNPMQVIAGCCDKLVKDFAGSHPLELKLLGVVKKNVDRMSRMTMRINRITRYATKDYVEGKKIIDIHEASNH